MKQLSGRLARGWTLIGARYLPFADAVSRDLPLGRLLRLSLFQLSVGMALVLLNGTLNRVMIIELEVPASLVAAMVALPLVFAPLRALIGFRSDNHRSVLGWRRVPFIWFGTLLQFGGLAIMPFALLVLSGDTHGPIVIGYIGAALAFLLVGAGMHTAQTAGLALATDLATEETRPRVVAFLYTMLLLGMLTSAVVFGLLLANFSQIKLIQVIQGAALATMLLNILALWKQEARDPSRTSSDVPPPKFQVAWREFRREGRSMRVLVAVALGTVGFSMQDILLEPYGGEVLSLSVGATTGLTALFACGALAGLALASTRLGRDVDPYRFAALGVLVGILAFSAVIFAAPLASTMLFCIGAGMIGFGGSIFAVSTMTAAMELAKEHQSGLVLGTWGAAQAAAAGSGVALGGAIRDGVGTLVTAGLLSPSLEGPATGYSVVYHLEIALLFCTLVAIGPLVRAARLKPSSPPARFGLAEIPS